MPGLEGLLVLSEIKRLVCRIFQYFKILNEINNRLVGVSFKYVALGTLVAHPDTDEAFAEVFSSLPQRVRTGTRRQWKGLRGQDIPTPRNVCNQAVVFGRKRRKGFEKEVRTVWTAWVRHLIFGCHQLFPENL